MPYEIVDDYPDCEGYAVVKQGTSEMMGCHRSRRDAARQLAALYAKEPNMDIARDAAERIALERAFPVELTEGDGRTIEARIVPWDTVAQVADPPDFEPYNEMWVRNTFEKQTSAPNRVKVFMNFEHEGGLRGIVGHGTELLDHEDGLHGVFRVHDNADGEKALHLVKEGLLGGVSLEAIPLRSVREDGVVKRLRAHLDKVSLVREPAFLQAQVVAVRNEVVVPEPAPAVSSELDERLRALGFEPLAKRAVVRTPWDGSPSRFTDEEYQRSCLIDRGGDAPVKERCSLPVLEPNGDLNMNALGPAAAALAGARTPLMGASLEQKASAARKLMRYYGQAGMDPPPSLRAIAAR